MRRALLTGVGKEGQVGEAVARVRGNDVFDLILGDRTAEGVSDRAAALTGEGFTVTGHACDLSDEGAVTSLFREVVAKAPEGLDALVHMAGGFGLSGPVAESSLEVWEKQLT